MRWRGRVDDLDQPCTYIILMNTPMADTYIIVSASILKSWLNNRLDAKNSRNVVNIQIPKMDTIAPKTSVKMENSFRKKQT